MPISDKFRESKGLIVSPNDGFGHSVSFGRKFMGRRDCVGEDFREALHYSKVAVSLRRDDSRIAKDFDWHLKAPIDLKANGNSAFFSTEREGDF